MATTYDQQQRRQPSTISSFIRWLKLKNYQYEVTFSLYMLSPTERVIFSPTPTIHALPDTNPCARCYNIDIVLLLIMAASMYLPDHIHQISSRIWYYVHGTNGNIAKATAAAVAENTDSLKSSLPVETAAEMMRKLHEL